MMPVDSNSPRYAAGCWYCYQQLAKKEKRTWADLLTAVISTTGYGIDKTAKVMPAACHWPPLALSPPMSGCSKLRAIDGAKGPTKGHWNGLGSCIWAILMELGRTSTCRQKKGLAGE
ncbi:hypothetical protein TRIATDRAFT_298160 [Trichoderma atroviride IMI 206040]|uniref:Uncharacterized protein n=1 Tax=Hypocrea atroviridis (strain ATCC 20476 / IMI 206040) TaxID=452589 RepID=G9NLW2_HYPAI|nr:uncharacterized protein TRIATDRAFT_298160 [Trichoderma atroviride IMI 206040]EHK47897.1 hypothetical protein TRIATDRAFT_298160 [Trichoderma atroviride IMI 206040]